MSDLIVERLLKQDAGFCITRAMLERAVADARADAAKFAHRELDAYGVPSKGEMLMSLPWRIQWLADQRVALTGDAAEKEVRKRERARLRGVYCAGGFTAMVRELQSKPEPYWCEHIQHFNGSWLIPGEGFVDMRWDICPVAGCHASRPTP